MISVYLSYFDLKKLPKKYMDTLFFRVTYRAIFQIYDSQRGALDFLDSLLLYWNICI